MRSAGKLDNTVIVYTSDNGFMYDDHGMSGKNSYWEESIRVPLVIKGPGVPENTTRSRLGNNLDVTATIEQLTGVTSLPPIATPCRRYLSTPMLLGAVASHRER